MRTQSARLPCGCRYEVSDRERWIERCPAHDAEDRELHERAAAERPATMAEFDRHIRVITGCGATTAERRETAALARWASGVRRP